MNNREEIAALKAEIARLNARIFTLESQRLAAPIVYHVPVPVPTSTRAPWDPPWGQTYCKTASKHLDPDFGRILVDNLWALYAR